MYVYIFVRRFDPFTMHHDFKHELLYFPRETTLCYSNLWIACNLPTFRLPDFIIWLRKIFLFTLNCFHSRTSTFIVSCNAEERLFSLLCPICLSFCSKRCYTRAYLWQYCPFFQPLILRFRTLSRMPIAFKKALFIIFISMRTDKYWDILFSRWTARSWKKGRSSCQCSFKIIYICKYIYIIFQWEISRRKCKIL